MRANNEKIRQHFPEQYEQRHNVVLIPTKLTSEEKYKQNWYAKYQQEFIEIEAWEGKDHLYQEQKSSDHIIIQPDQVLIKAALGGDPHADCGYWIVPADRYALRDELGYIISTQDTFAELLDE